MRTIVGICGVMIVCGLTMAQEPAATPTPAPAAAATPAPAAAAPAVASVPAGPGLQSIKIVCDGKVKTNGEAALVFTPTGGSAKEIKVTLQKGMSKAEVCKDVAKELTVMLGDQYKVDHYDDDKVKVEAKGKTTFNMTLGGQSATGITLELKK